MKELNRLILKLKTRIFNNCKVELETRRLENCGDFGVAKTRKLLSF